MNDDFCDTGVSRYGERKGENKPERERKRKGGLFFFCCWCFRTRRKEKRQIAVPYFTTEEEGRYLEIEGSEKRRVKTNAKGSAKGRVICFFLLLVFPNTSQRKKTNRRSVLHNRGMNDDFCDTGVSRHAISKRSSYTASIKEWQKEW
jgi:hypothetical protein